MEPQHNGEKKGLRYFFNNLKNGRSLSKSCSAGGILPQIRPGQSSDSGPGFLKDHLDDVINMTPEKIVSLKTTISALNSMVASATESGDYGQLKEFYTKAFDSFANINVIFKREVTPSGPAVTDYNGIDEDLLDTTYSILMSLPPETRIGKVVLRGIINCLMAHNKITCKDDIRACLILLQNPQFKGINTYVVMSHLIRLITSLPDFEHHFLIHWFARLHTDNFKNILNMILQFIGVRMFPPKLSDLPPAAKCTWWVPSATKIIALLNAANVVSGQEKVEFTDFYCRPLDSMPLMDDFLTWKNKSGHKGFLFCRYSFILSVVAKRKILQQDSECQMISEARQSLVEKVQRHQVPDMEMLFLNINVRRRHIVQDSLNQLLRKHADLKKKLKVTFVGEVGVDMGGLTKEWFQLIIKKVFHPDYGMFVVNSKSQRVWFNHACKGSKAEYQLIGTLMGLAVYNSTILDLHFPICCYKKLISPATLPPRGQKVGITTMGLDDLEQIMPDTTKGLRDLMDYEGDVEEDFGLTFLISLTEDSGMKTYPLKENGDNIAVTSKNRKEYVSRYVNFILNQAVYTQFAAFYHGFHHVCDSAALLLLKPAEVERLVCGHPDIDVTALRLITKYDGYSPSDVTIKLFWTVLETLSSGQQRKFLMFTTGTNRIPVGGMQEMTFKITRADVSCEMLPISHTCFNQLCLPPYTSKKQVKPKLLIAINNAQGFGLE